MQIPGLPLPIFFFFLHHIDFLQMFSNETKQYITKHNNQKYIIFFRYFNHSIMILHLKNKSQYLLVFYVYLVIVHISSASGLDS